MANSSRCDFCSIVDCNLGIQSFVKLSVKDLSEILEEENEKKQKIGDKLMKHNQMELIRLFNLGEGFQYQKFNNLALDKLRKYKDNESDLGNKRVMIFNQSIPFCFKLNCSIWGQETRC